MWLYTFKNKKKSIINNCMWLYILLKIKNGQLSIITSDYIYF